MQISTLALEPQRNDKKAPLFVYQKLLDLDYSISLQDTNAAKEYDIRSRIGNCMTT